MFHTIHSTRQLFNHSVCRCVWVGAKWCIDQPCRVYTIRSYWYHAHILKVVKKSDRIPKLSYGQNELVKTGNLKYGSKFRFGTRKYRYHIILFCGKYALVLGNENIFPQLTVDKNSTPNGRAIRPHQPVNYVHVQSVDISFGNAPWRWRL